MAEQLKSTVDEIKLLLAQLLQEKFPEEAAAKQPSTLPNIHKTTSICHHTYPPTTPHTPTQPLYTTPSPQANNSVTQPFSDQPFSDQPPTLAELTTMLKTWVHNTQTSTQTFSNAKPCPSSQTSYASPMFSAATPLAPPSSTISTVKQQLPTLVTSNLIQPENKSFIPQYGAQVLMRDVEDPLPREPTTTLQPEPFPPTHYTEITPPLSATQLEFPSFVDIVTAAPDSQLQLIKRGDAVIMNVTFFTGRIENFAAWLDFYSLKKKTTTLAKNLTPVIDGAPRQSLNFLERLGCAQSNGTNKLGFPFFGPDPPVHYTSPLPRPDPDPPNIYSSNRNPPFTFPLSRDALQRQTSHHSLPPPTDSHSGQDPLPFPSPITVATIFAAELEGIQILSRFMRNGSGRGAMSLHLTASLCDGGRAGHPHRSPLPSHAPSKPLEGIHHSRRSDLVGLITSPIYPLLKRTVESISTGVFFSFLLEFVCFDSLNFLSSLLGTGCECDMIAIDSLQGTLQTMDLPRTVTAVCPNLLAHPLFLVAGHEIEELLDDQKEILDKKRWDFELELEEKRKSLDEELRSKVTALEKQEFEINHGEEKLGKREEALDKKSERVKEKEKDLEARMRSVKEREKYLKSEEKKLELENQQLTAGKESLQILKVDIDKIEAETSQQELHIQEECQKLKISEEERSEYLHLQALLKQQRKKCRHQQELLLKEQKDLTQEREKFETEWEVLDEKRKRLSKEQRNIVDKKQKLEKLRQSKEESFKKEESAMRDYIQKELEAIRLEKESFEALIRHEQLCLSRKAKNDSKKMLEDYEMQRINLHTELLNRQGKMDKELQERKRAKTFPNYSMVTFSLEDKAVLGRG